MNKLEFAKFKSHIDKLAEKHYQRARKMPNSNLGQTMNNWYARGMKRAYREIEALGLVSDWVNINDGLPDDNSTDDYLAYSIHTEVYEKVSVSKLKQMISNSAKITHWRLCPLPPKE